MAAMLETPSRIWRRIEAIEDRDMPSLPSLPAFGDSEGEEESHNQTSNRNDADEVDEQLSDISAPMHSTPAASSHHTSTIRAASSTSSASRFANSIARTSRSSMGRSSTRGRQSHPDSFDDISAIPSLPDVHPERGTGHFSEEGTDEEEDEVDFRRSRESVPEVYLPPDDDEADGEQDLSLTDALESVSRASSPELFSKDEPTPKKNYDYSVSLRSEPQPSPFDKFRNVALRRPAPRARTPSLSRTTSSSASSPTNSTPRSNISAGFPRSNAASPAAVPLPRSATASPAIIVSRPDEDESVGENSYFQDGDTHSMDITDVHISPLRTGQEEQEEDVQEPSSNDDDGSREPTFSSDGGPTFRPDQTRQSDARATPRHSPGGLSSAFSSPAPSVAFTPTPAFPHPRARFDLPSPPNNAPTAPHPNAEDAEDGEGAEEPLTPHTRRRSFLLSFPTPHPRNTRRALLPPRDADTDTPESTPGPNPRSAALGGTPAPALRTASHPLAQTYSAASGSGGVPWATPGAGSGSSPHDGASIISTASSHDLTTHHYRANASFDPVMGFGVGAQGLHGLNTYLHGLNRRLQEENEGLVARLKNAGRRASVGGGAGRRASGGGTALGNVEENEKAELEDMVEAYKEEAERCAAEKEEVKKALERWKARMKEVEKGVEGILRVAGKRADGAEDAALQRAKEIEKRMAEAQEERDAERVLEKLREANERVGKELEDEVMQSDARLKEERAFSETLEQELDAKMTEMAAQELRATKTYVTELEQAAEVAAQAIEDQAMEQVESLEGARERAEELARQMEEALEAAEKKMLEDEHEVAQLKGKVASLERDRERQRDQSEASQDPSGSRLVPGPTEADMEALEEELDGANREIARLNTLLSQSPARKAIEMAKDAKIDMLEKEREDLLERNKALRTTVTEMGTPTKAFNMSGISPIHRQVLSLSMRAPKTPGGPLRDMSWLNATAADGTPSPLVAEIARLQYKLDQANESIDDKLDKLGDAGLGVVGLTKRLEDARARIVILEEEIARLSRKEERRVHRLERARCQKCMTKVDLRSAIRAEADESSVDAFSVSLPSEPPTPPTRTSEALRADLHSVNSHLSRMKKQWEDEKKKLLGEKAVLQDAANRLNLKVRTAEEEVRMVAETKKAGEKLRVGVEGELEEAKRVISDLEADLKSERSRLRALSTEQNRVEREKENVLLQLQRTETDMGEVKQQLQRFKEENHELEAELRVNVNAEQKARLLEVRVSENAETVEQLRQERSMLAMDHKNLQLRFSEISEHANRLRTEHRASQVSHDDRRHELDLQLGEIDDLRHALEDQADQLQRAEAERNRIAAEKSDVAKNVAALEADLRRVRRDAEAFGRDLKLLRSEKERLEAKQREEATRAERTRKQSQTQIRVLTEQLEGQRAKTLRAKEDLRSHVCVMDERQLSALKLQHNKECKGLIVQIRYLKAKFTRESALRGDLCYQKDYLLVLLSKFEKSEHNIIASIARIGFPVAAPPPVKKPKKLRTLALTVIFLSRVKYVMRYSAQFVALTRRRRASGGFPLVLLATSRTASFENTYERPLQIVVTPTIILFTVVQYLVQEWKMRKTDCSPCRPRDTSIGISGLTVLAPIRRS
ncbi:hypothetical protein B0H17DRAFT_1158623 [Mycena rosella]|uniref:Pericentrin/AKAP-450 centrosomal targeting domain-containing protein n=1 Tax=Mycena rosella TaxID=1033263 RepID=A0AAD7GMT8_MYCRO|nr:hypothetical protein B0H17DRAFT_1158623 [Mycena rosella]